MSLQNLPSEDLPEQPSLPADTPTTLEKSYSRRLFDYAWREMRREQATVSVIASEVGTILVALIVGSIWGGIAAGVVAGLLTFIVTSILLFVFNFVRAPKVLDNQLREQLRGARWHMEEDNKDNRRRDYIILRLQEFIKQDGEFNQGSWVVVDYQTISAARYRDAKVERFLAQYFDEAHVKRFKEKGIVALEEILLEYLNVESRNS